MAPKTRTNELMLRLIIDTDPGIDDALALVLALTSPEDIDVIGLTTVFGNKSVDLTTTNALKILALTQARNHSVYAGCQHPLMSTAISDYSHHGNDGLGDIGLAPPALRPQEKHAVDFMIDEVMGRPPDSVTLCAIAPLTNIALACVKEPKFPTRLAALYVMGGNAASNTAEFNFRSDPQAAAIVLRSGAHVTLIGLNVTRQVTVANSICDALTAYRGEMIDAVRKMLEFSKVHDAALHDICVIASLLDSSLFEFRDATIEVEWRNLHRAGKCTVDQLNAPSGTRIATAVDVSGLSDFIVERLIRSIA